MTIELPHLEEQRAFNVRRWAELQQDRALARLPYRVETDRFGRLLMTPPPSFDHAERASRVAQLLRDLSPQGRVFGETPVSTADGVKVTDAAWFSAEQVRRFQPGESVGETPAICIEVLSPSNTHLEMSEKRALYLEAGADEVWVCELDGTLHFFEATGRIERSRVCPPFPRAV